VITVESPKPFTHFRAPWSCSATTALFFVMLGFALFYSVPQMDKAYEDRGGFSVFSATTAFLVQCSRIACKGWFLFVPSAVALTILAWRIPQSLRVVFNVLVLVATVIMVGLLGCAYMGFRPFSDPIRAEW
jgi:hypothetical protein